MFSTFSKAWRMRKELVEKSRFLSLVLRHKPERAGIILDKNGWTSIEDLLEKTAITRQELLEIVETNDKKRFAIEGDKIRAEQGHSIEVDLELKQEIPPLVLYHGTKCDYLGSIMSKGLVKGDRTHVHLSLLMSTAREVADRRKGKSAILQVDCKNMFRDGYRFYKSGNNVWLTLEVPPKYLKRII